MGNDDFSDIVAQYRRSVRSGVGGTEHVPALVAHLETASVRLEDTVSKLTTGDEPDLDVCPLCRRPWP